MDAKVKHYQLVVNKNPLQTMEARVLCVGYNHLASRFQVFATIKQTYFNDFKYGI